jgi:hypothetical protein
MRQSFSVEQAAIVRTAILLPPQREHPKFLNSHSATWTVDRQAGDLDGDLTTLAAMASAAKMYGVSVSLLQMRLNVTGALIRIARRGHRAHHR